MLVEGCSMRSTSRVVDLSINTVTKLLEDAGRAAEAFHDTNVRHVKAQRVQADEIWSFCYARKKNVPIEKMGKGEAGDVWTWTALDSDSKMMLSWVVGDRTSMSSHALMYDLADRIDGECQISTDGLHWYKLAVSRAFGDRADYGQIHKVYAPTVEEGPSRRYGPGVCIAAKKHIVFGDPDMAKISTSHVERSNLSIRMGNRRFTRLTNAFSKKIDNHCHALALYFWHYNFARIHKSLRMTPAMAAGITDRVMDMADLVKLIDEANPPKKRGPYKKAAA